MHATAPAPRSVNAAAHALFFYVSWFFRRFSLSRWSTHKRCLHDMLAGVNIVRRT